MTSEEWRDVPGWEGLYQVSSLGRVRSVERLAIQKRWGRPNVRVVRERILKPYTSGPKPPIYLMVRLYRDGKKTQRKVHHLVAEAFLGPKPFEDAKVLHWDDDQSNNRADNLRWGTQSENCFDRERNKRLKSNTY
ncbi:hypothetical protein JOEDIRT_76 [Mycobacterium phage JoeDirt]|uniref:HNH endonuclease n=2 Tax=Bronvirus TaxID=1623278 RepID=G1BQK5_9CAUD|nr:HNH endonuclease [Mycobacterium phage JoeDirt]YP_010114774.1 HNH endonuclease [Mycobacterium phage OhShagHennessy]AEK07107.1 hypothetical protein JOEDIRT_76 [Mycobacterium phage JoeDirt]QQV92777.1 hypothetical protein SEA_OHSHAGHENNESSY_74 [Mycobacterium phage OhShagHennessy]